MTDRHASLIFGTKSLMPLP